MFRVKTLPEISVFNTDSAVFSEIFVFIHQTTEYHKLKEKTNITYIWDVARLSIGLVEGYPNRIFHTSQGVPRRIFRHSLPVHTCNSFLVFPFLLALDITSACEPACRSKLKANLNRAYAVFITTWETQA
jgi:hypothetical protein